ARGSNGSSRKAENVKSRRSCLIATRKSQIMRSTTRFWRVSRRSWVVRALRTGMRITARVARRSSEGSLVAMQRPPRDRSTPWRRSF
ncbi:hypothetical protein KEM55_004320, partial [Ascosphaera atra]